MSSCPKSFHTGSTKAGMVKGRQRWKCKEGNYHYTVTHRGASKEKKRQALMFYLEGLGFRSIGRILKYSHVTIYNWIRGFGEELEKLKSQKELKIVDIDEMHT